MELTKEEMKKVIAWLEAYYVSYGVQCDDIDDLPKITHKFKTYLKGGEL